MDTSTMTSIHNSRGAMEGDLYLDTMNHIYKIGLTHGLLTHITDNQNIDSIKLIQDSLLAVYITRGKADTTDLSRLVLLNKNWFEEGTNRPANSITDSIYTEGNIRLSDYLSNRADDTSSYLNTLYTDINGNVKSGRREIIPPVSYIDVSILSTGNTFNYYNHYATQTTNVGLSPIPLANLDFYVLNYDPAVFANVSISATGVLTYDVIAIANTKTFIDVRFYTK